MLGVRVFLRPGGLQTSERRPSALGTSESESGLVPFPRSIQCLFVTLIRHRGIGSHVGSASPFARRTRNRRVESVDRNLRALEPFRHRFDRGLAAAAVSETARIPRACFVG